MTKMRRSLLVAMSALLLVAVAVGGTVAWLTAETAPVTNTFSPSTINIKLDETNPLDLKMVPGKVITKDPKVTVLANSEACWLFVKIEESGNFGTFFAADAYTVADGWTALPGNDGVYYRTVAASEDDQVFPVLKDNEITVSTGVTKTQMEALTEQTRPTLTFTAYAVQQASFNDAVAAWAEASK